MNITFRVVRAIVYFLLLLGLQGALASLLAPLGVTAPDLFLLTGVALALRLRSVPALLAGYGVGLLQDVLGHGLLGLHAAAVAGGVLLVLGARRQLTDGGVVGAILTVVIAILGQWTAFLILTYWLRGGLVTVDALMRVLPWELALTVLVYPLWNRLMSWGLGPRPGADAELAA
ncbi:Rod shape-determining protein MreD [Deinococcus sonorensis]|uniref:Rod shape-determining protein MreD n=2 Tax=Deinococcus sonorensis TaxID=309891 RepID=A0AAU7UA95_9DEIO